MSEILKRTTADLPGRRIRRQAPSPANAARRTPLWPFAIWAVVAAFLPFVADGASLLLWELIAIQIVFALGTNILVGHANVHTFGQAAFFGVGGYGVAVLVTRGWSTPLALLVGVVLCALLGVFIAALSTRASPMGTLMITVAVAQSLYMLAGRLSAFGGDNGLSVIAMDIPSTVGWGYWYLVAGLCGAAVLLMWLVASSPLGALLHALRDDPVKISHLGIDVRLVRIAAFALSGAFCGFAGALAAVTQSAVSPQTFHWIVSGNALIMCVLGGLRSFWGPAAGAVLYMLLTHELQGAFPEISTLAIGVVLLVVVLLLPGGLAEAPVRLRAMARHWRGERQG